MTLTAPFPWPGGKRRVAAEVWARFGDVPNFVEPFFGSGAVLLGRPHVPRIETVNDADAYLANFWRAVAWPDPVEGTRRIESAAAEVARWADWPVNEEDLHSRHRWLVEQADFRDRMRADPSYFDAKIAGWWVWGLCAWIGSGFCAPGREARELLPSLAMGGDGTKGQGWGKGVHAKAFQSQIPHRGGGSFHDPTEKIPLLGGTTGAGVHRRSAIPSQLPHLGGAGSDYGQGLHGVTARSAILDTFQALAARLRGVRVACGDFERILSDSITWRHGTTAIFLDPPYPGFEAMYSERDGAEGAEHVWHRAARWAAEHGDDARLRIALCGYEGSWKPPASWSTLAWKAHGGYGGQRKKGAKNENARRERVWFSPGCLAGEQQQTLFG